MVGCAAASLTLDRVLVMGIVNVTPDSFADGGRYLNHAMHWRMRVS